MFWFHMAAEFSFVRGFGWSIDFKNIINFDIVEPYNASRQSKFQFRQKVGKGRHVYVRVGGNIANAWLPCSCTNIWGNFKGT